MASLFVDDELTTLPRRILSRRIAPTGSDPNEIQVYYKLIPIKADWHEIESKRRFCVDYLLLPLSRDRFVEVPFIWQPFTAHGFASEEASEKGNHNKEEKEV